MGMLDFTVSRESKFMIDQVQQVTARSQFQAKLVVKLKKKNLICICCWDVSAEESDHTNHSERLNDSVFQNLSIRILRAWS